MVEHDTLNQNLTYRSTAFLEFAYHNHSEFCVHLNLTKMFYEGGRRIDGFFKRSVIEQLEFVFSAACTV